MLNDKSMYMLEGDGDDTARMIAYLRNNDLHRPAPVSRTMDVSPRGDIEFTTTIPYKPPRPPKVSYGAALD